MPKWYQGTLEAEKLASGVRLGVDPTGLPGGVQLIHNYGHGGAGVTLAWGCADGS